MRQGIHGLAVIRKQPGCPLERLAGFQHLFLAAQRNPQVEVGYRQLRIERQCLPAIVLRARAVAAQTRDQAAHEPRIGIQSVCLAKPLIELLCFVILTCLETRQRLLLPGA